MGGVIERPPPLLKPSGFHDWLHLSFQFEKKKHTRTSGHRFRDPPFRMDSQSFFQRFFVPAGQTTGSVLKASQPVTETCRYWRSRGAFSLGNPEESMRGTDKESGDEIINNILL